MTLTTAGLVVLVATLVGVLGLGGTSAQAGPPDALAASQGVSITVEVTGDATATPSPAPTPTPTHNPGGGGTTGGGSGTLAKTGERIALLGGIGLALVAAGALVRVLARRGAVGNTP